jgi:2-keto-4-pentenoate hydratase/2-oxohepta-3-ene-1,7-dioic acid hydratase in catechol pathway
MTGMKIGRFATKGGATGVGVLVGALVADVTKAADVTPDVLRHLTADIRSEIQSCISHAPTVPLDDATWKAPVPRPPKFLAMGLNYRQHAAEAGVDLPSAPLFFNKQSTCVVGPGDAILIPAVSDQVDYEGELAFVINQHCRHVPTDKATEVIGGYTICNDVSVRDWQRKSPTMTLGKSFDTHGPLGPYLVTPDELGDGSGLRLTTTVNGSIRQNTSTSDMIVSCAEMVSYLSAVFTLEPGDVISTGTPAGTGSWFSPPKWLRPGDTVQIDIESIGSLVNPVANDH